MPRYIIDIPDGLSAAQTSNILKMFQANKNVSIKPAALWKLIKSAPKDGTVFLAVGYASEFNTSPPSSDTCFLLHCKWNEELDCFEDVDNDQADYDHQKISEYLTHWTEEPPLPTMYCG